MKTLKRLQSGLVQIPVLLGLALMLVALPVVSNMVKQNQENRSQAASCGVEGSTTGCPSGYTCHNYSCVCTAASCGACVPNCNCAANTCSGQTCRNSCGTGDCAGIKSCTVQPTSVPECPTVGRWGGCSSGTQRCEGYRPNWPNCETNNDCSIGDSRSCNNPSTPPTTAPTLADCNNGCEANTCSGQVCYDKCGGTRQGTKNCTAADQCTGSATECDGNAVKVCINGYWTKKDCLNGQACNTKTGMCEAFHPTEVPTAVPTPANKSDCEAKGMTWSCGTYDFVTSCTCMPNPQISKCNAGATSCRALCIGDELEVGGSCTYTGRANLQYSGKCCGTDVKLVDQTTCNLLPGLADSCSNCKNGYHQDGTYVKCGPYPLIPDGIKCNAFEGYENSCSNCKNPYHQNGMDRVCGPVLTLADNAQCALLPGLDRSCSNCANGKHYTTLKGEFCGTPVSDVTQCENSSVASCRDGIYGCEGHGEVPVSGSCSYTGVFGKTPGLCCIPRPIGTDVSRCESPETATCRSPLVGGCSTYNEISISGSCTYKGVASFLDEPGVCCVQKAPTLLRCCRYDYGTGMFGVWSNTSQCINNPSSGNYGEDTTGSSCGPKPTLRCCKYDYGTGSYGVWSDVTQCINNPSSGNYGEDTTGSSCGPKPECVKAGDSVLPSQLCCDGLPRYSDDGVSKCGSAVTTKVTPVVSPITCLVSGSTPPDGLVELCCSKRVGSDGRCSGNSTPVPTRIPTVQPCAGVCKTGASCSAMGLANAPGECSYSQYCCNDKVPAPTKNPSCPGGLLNGISCSSGKITQCVDGILVNWNCPSGQCKADGSGCTVPLSGTPIPDIWATIKPTVIIYPTAGAVPTGVVQVTPGVDPTRIPVSTTPAPTSKVTSVPNPSAPPAGPTGSAGSGACSRSIEVRVHKAVATDPLVTSLAVNTGEKISIACLIPPSTTPVSQARIVVMNSTGNRTELSGALMDWTPTVAGAYSVFCEDLSCNNKPSTNTATVNVTGSGTASCKECPNDFKCYQSAKYMKLGWYVTGYVPEGFENVAVPDSYCDGIPKPTWLGKGNGDANCDGYLNGADYSTWRSEYLDVSKGQQVARSTWEADFNCDSYVNGYDYSLWRSRYLR